MRHLQKGSHIAEIYGDTRISERHRHRYEVNTAYRARLEKAGLKFAGMSPDGLLPETVEYPDHPWFIGVQYHPELKSKPFEPHPLFASFIAGGRGAKPHGVNSMGQNMFRKIVLACVFAVGFACQAFAFDARPSSRRLILPSGKRAPHLMRQSRKSYRMM